MALLPPVPWLRYSIKHLVAVATLVYAAALFVLAISSDYIVVFVALLLASPAWLAMREFHSRVNSAALTHLVDVY